MEEEDFAESDDPHLKEAFKIWKSQRKLTQSAVELSGENSEVNDGWLIYNAGCTSQDDGPALPVHISTEQEIEQMIKQFGTKMRCVLADLGLPAGICLARSTKDGYCPEAQGQFANFLSNLHFQTTLSQKIYLSFLRTQIVESIQSSVIAVLKEIFKEFSPASKLLINEAYKS